jgi:cyclase
MLKKRLIAVLILRDGLVVQSVQFKHTNVIHWKPVTAVDFWDRWAVDEIVVLDVSRNKSKRDKFYNVVEGLSKKCFVPLTVGGWVENLDEFRRLTRLGADKIVVNTEAYRHPELITEASQVFGNQCVVVSIDTHRREDGTHEVVIDRGREPTGEDPAVWAVRAQEAGSGELFINCIEQDGFRQGYDLKLLKRMTSVVSIPVIAFGGVFTWEHFVEGVIQGGADAVAAANILHYTEHSTKKAKEYMRSHGVDVR